jgi:hypothetical protein
MNALEQAAELQQQAIILLLNEREQIEVRLLQLGYTGETKTAPLKKRGRPPMQQAVSVAHFDTNPAGGSLELSKPAS